MKKILKIEGILEKTLLYIILKHSKMNIFKSLQKIAGKYTSFFLSIKKIETTLVANFRNIDIRRTFKKF